MKNRYIKLFAFTALLAMVLSVMVSCSFFRDRGKITIYNNSGADVYITLEGPSGVLIDDYYLYDNKAIAYWIYDFGEYKVFMGVNLVQTYKITNFDDLISLTL